MTDKPGPNLQDGEITAGMRVKLDSGFTCIDPCTIEIQEDQHGLFFPCEDGHHYIDGQLEEDGRYVGIYPETEPYDFGTESEFRKFEIQK